jgi:hypothetical protein
LRNKAPFGKGREYLIDPDLKEAQMSRNTLSSFRRLAGLILLLGFAASGASAWASVIRVVPSGSTGDAAALVIGVGVGVGVDGGPCRSCVLEARAVAAALQGAGWRVTQLTNSTDTELRVGLAAFRNSIGGASAAIIYVASSGMRLANGEELVSGANGGLARGATASGAPEHFVPVQAFVDTLRDATGLSLGMLFLDAIGGEPDATAIATRVPPSTGDLVVVYSAAPGQSPADGQDGINAFASAFIELVKGQPLSVGEFLAQLNGRVIRSTTARASLPPQRIFVMGSWVADAPTLGGVTATPQR